MVTVGDKCSGGTRSQNYAVSELEQEQPQLSSLFTKIPPPPPPVKQEQISSEAENDESFKHEGEEIKPVASSVQEEIINGGGRGLAAADGAVRPMEGLSEAGPPPFLKKTFEMVDDAATNDAVSWSESRDSFVVWDPHEFSKNLLPRYFKHCNFSSFIRQLNTYGFKKVDPDRWEFANSGFKGGKKHLLKYIKRRSKYSKSHHRGIKSSSSPLTSDSPKPLFDAELDSLKHDQDSLRVEISKIRQEHNNSRRKIAAMEERIRSSECRHNQMMTFLMKTISSPEFIRQLIQKRDRRRELDGNAVEIRKRKRISSTTTIPDGETDHDQSVVTENLADGTHFSTESYSRLFPDHEEVKESSGCSDVFSENLVDEISILDEELSVSDSKFYNELEDLVEKPRDYWGAYMTSLVDQTCFELRG